MVWNDGWSVDAWSCLEGTNVYGVGKNMFSEGKHGQSVMIVRHRQQDDVNSYISQIHKKRITYGKRQKLFPEV